MWASGGPSVDGLGRVHIATGANFGSTAKKLGIPGIFPSSNGSWGQSILQFSDDRTSGLRLTGSYAPFNYCRTSASDIDLGSSGTILIDLPPSSTSTPHLLALAGGKQGNFYLIVRDHMPGNTTRRQPCSTDPESDGSLLAPDPQPHFGLRGPISLFGPYSDYISMLDQAKSRTTAAYFRDTNDDNYVFVTGSSKTGADFSISEPPGLAKVRIVTKSSHPAYPEIAALEMTQTFVNPGSPVVTSNAGTEAIVWMLDANARRAASLYGESPPQPILYAFAADDLALLWKSKPGELFASGKYNEPTVVNGLAIVGTDRIQAYGLRRQIAAEKAQVVAPKSESKRQIPTPAVTASASESIANGGRIFQSRCASCHSSGQPGIPTKTWLAKLPQNAIMNALLTGAMRPMASGLSRDEVADIAKYLSRAR